MNLRELVITRNKVVDGLGFTNNAWMITINLPGLGAIRFWDKELIDEDDYADKCEREVVVNRYLASIRVAVPDIVAYKEPHVLFSFIDGDVPSNDDVLNLVPTIARVHITSHSDGTYQTIRQYVPTRDSTLRFSQMQRWANALMGESRIALDGVRQVLDLRDRELSSEYTLSLRDVGAHNAIRSSDGLCLFDFERASHSSITDDVAALVVANPHFEDDICGCYLESIGSHFPRTRAVYGRELAISMFEKSLEILAFFVGLRSVQQVDGVIISKYQELVRQTYNNLQI